MPTSVRDLEMREIEFSERNKKEERIFFPLSKCRWPDLNRHGFPLDFESSASAIPPRRQEQKLGYHFFLFFASPL